MGVASSLLSGGYAKEVEFGEILETGDLRTKFLELMEFKIKTSHELLFESTVLASASIQRPGLSKYLRELSGTYWSEGVTVLKKFYEKGGKISSDDVKYFKFTAGVKGTVKYDDILKDTAKNSVEMSKKIRTLLGLIGNNDGDLIHFFEELLEEDSKRARQLTGHYYNIHNMADNPQAVFQFDHNF